MLTNTCDNELTIGCTNMGTVEMHSFLFCEKCAADYATKREVNRNVITKARAEVVTYQKSQTIARRQSAKEYLISNRKRYGK